MLDSRTTAASTYTQVVSVLRNTSTYGQRTRNNSKPVLPNFSISTMLQPISKKQNLPVPGTGESTIYHDI